MSDSLYFLRGNSNAAAEILAFDWTGTSIGAPEGWPGALKTAVSIMLASHFPKAIVWGPDRVTLHNDAFRPMLGHKPKAIGHPFSEVWSEAWDQIGPIAEKAFQGEPTFVENYPLSINRNGYDEEAFFTFCYSPIRDENGVVSGIMDTVMEVTETVTTQRRLAVMNGELAHRMKNMVAVISAIASQTLRSASSVSEAQHALQQRLTALGHAQNLLTSSNNSGARVADISRFALEAVSVDEEQIHISGPNTWLGEKQTLSLALVVNELATNSFKYGALAAPVGRVAVTWEVFGPRGEEQFSFSWVETGGEPAQAPARKGFGSAILERIAPSDFHGTAEAVYGDAGFRYELKTSAKSLLG